MKNSEISSFEEKNIINNKINASLSKRINEKNSKSYLRVLC